MNEPRIIPYGDCALLVQYDMAGYAEDVCRAVQALAVSLRAKGQWTEVVGGYDSLLVSFDQMTLTMDQAHSRVKAALGRLDVASEKPGELIEIPVHYGGEDGPDIGIIAKSSGLTEADVIKLHCSQDYLVCMMGFVPGFAFLSQAPEALHHPRHKTPRLSVAAGSVGIAGWQTGIYGLETPGGWQIIGRTPLKMFDPARAEPFLAKAGDRIRFVPFDGGKT